MSRQLAGRRAAAPEIICAAAQIIFGERVQVWQHVEPAIISHMSGKIVAIVAPTRSGKSFLTAKLAEYYKVPALYEVPSGDIPAEVKDSIRTGSSIDGWLYFRNRSLSMHVEALELAKTNTMVLLDAPWVSNRPYTMFYSADTFHRDLLLEISDLDHKTLPWPDVIILLTGDDEMSRRLWTSSGKDFENDPTYFEERLLPLKREFEKYIADFSSKCPVITIDRTALDFNKAEDLKVVTDKLDAVLI